MHDQHRARFREAMDEGDVALFTGARIVTRNHDVGFPFRQRSDFWYLTGCPEPDAALLLAKGVSGVPDETLFVLPRDPEREIWDGKRLGPEGARERLGFGHAEDRDRFHEAVAEALTRARRAWCALGVDPALDELLARQLPQLRAKSRRGVQAPAAILDPHVVLDELRLFKGEEELEHMRRAAAITVEGHLLAMAQTAPGEHEYAIEALLNYVFRRHGGDGGGWSYPAIVAGGANACILHYTQNDAELRAGDLLLVDAGAEYRSYAADVTRTWPVDGRFTAAQRSVYEVVLAAQEAAIDRARPGVRFDEVHQAALRTLCEGLCDLGVVQESVDVCIEEQLYRRWFMHNTSHWIGLDVHDAGQYHREGRERELEPGMVLTVEPGLYFQADDEKIPESLRGIGVRIEDDVHVTGGDPEVLTAAAPKRVADVEDACAAERAAPPTLESSAAAG